MGKGECYLVFAALVTVCVTFLLSPTGVGLVDRVRPLALYFFLLVLLHCNDRIWCILLSDERKFEIPWGLCWVPTFFWACQRPFVSLKS